MTKMNAEDVDLLSNRANKLHEKVMEEFHKVIYRTKPKDKGLPICSLAVCLTISRLLNGYGVKGGDVDLWLTNLNKVVKDTITYNDSLEKIQQ